MSQPTEPQHRFTQFLDRACVDLGFCLPPRVVSELAKSAPKSAAGFVTQVMLAEGLSPKDHPGHFESLKMLLNKYVAVGDFDAR